MNTKNHFRRRAEALIEATAQAQQLNARALILTIFGDSICAHGGVIWLGSLIRLVKPFGINQRLVRTSVFRLAEKDILQSKQIGRRSFYTLTDKGWRQFSHASERIYRYENANWDGAWRLVFTNLNDISSKQRETFKKELHWLGFNRLSNGVYGHPLVNIEAVREIVNEMQLQDAIVLMQANNCNDNPLDASASLVRHVFKSTAIDAEYREFIAAFDAILDDDQMPLHGDEELCFLLRTLLIHRYRRILLHEPELPRELLPADSPSQRARKLTGRLYRKIGQAAEAHFMTTAESENGALPEIDAEFFSRFAGVTD